MIGYMILRPYKKTRDI